MLSFLFEHTSALWFWVSPANLREEKVTNFLLARRGHQGGEESFVYRYTPAAVRPDGHGNAQMRHGGRSPFARGSRAQRAVANAPPHPDRYTLRASPARAKYPRSHH